MGETNTSRQQNVQENCNKPLREANCDWKETTSLLDYVCCQIAERYNLFSKGEPRRAAIIEVLARNTCLGCIAKELQTKSFQRIDNMYSEIHQLAAGLLIEALYDQLVTNGHKVTISAEASIKYGTADVIIIPSRYGISLQSNRVEIVVEIKTGFSLSVPQLLRYLIDNDKRSLILWRIRNEQVLLLEGPEIRLLVLQFVRMIVSRADKLLQGFDVDCGHSTDSKSWRPNSQQLQEAFSDFAKGVVSTLTSVVETITQMIGEQQN